MRVGFDLDGTLTDFEKFVLEHAPEYMKSKYNMDIVNVHGYDVDQVFDIENELTKRGFSKEQAVIEANKILSEFWEKFYVSYSLLTPFRPGVKETIDKLRKDGVEILIFTSRKKTCDKGILGEIVRKTTRLQFLLNKIRIENSKLIFLPTDEAKLDVLRKYNLVAMVDDKPELVTAISEFTDVVCINCSYNINHNIPISARRVAGYENDQVYNAIKNIIYEKQRIVYPHTTTLTDGNLAYAKQMFATQEIVPDKVKTLQEAYAKTKI